MLDLPPSERAYAHLADALRHGVYPPGRRLPGERTLAEALEVSRVTLRKALARLQAEGSLQSSAQQGWFVPDQLVGPPPPMLQTFTELARARGLQATSRVLSATVRPATLDEASRLRMGPAEDVLHLERLRGMGGRPLCLDKSTMPLTLVEPLVHLDLTDRSLYESLHDRCGIEIVRASHSVQAEAADEGLAGLLEVAVGSPVLIESDVAYSSDDTPVILGMLWHRGDAYRFEADLFRPQANSGSGRPLGNRSSSPD
ncbi:MAG: GntR family transcriptional regulator [Propionibacteriaceae bacterium]|jgi:GntR family transcriptional regulator|nr:GntR family transcriptional regulator [Propionibacteriaceae bacterium]